MIAMFHCTGRKRIQTALCKHGTFYDMLKMNLPYWSKQIFFCPDHIYSHQRQVNSTKPLLKSLMHYVCLMPFINVLLTPTELRTSRFTQKLFSNNFLSRSATDTYKFYSNSRWFYSLIGNPSGVEGFRITSKNLQDKSYTCNIIIYLWRYCAFHLMSEASKFS